MLIQFTLSEIRQPFIQWQGLGEKETQKQQQEKPEQNKTKNPHNI